MVKKKIMAFLLASAMVLGLSGCGNAGEGDASPDPGGSQAETGQQAVKEEKQQQPEAGDGQIEMLVYHRNSEMVDFWDDFCKKVNEKYPNIYLEQELQKEESTLQVKYASGDDPEILCGPATQQYIDMGKYGDFSEHQEWIERIDPALIPAVTDAKTGKIYRLPMCRGIIGIYYNKDVFEELGLDVAQTWDEFIENLKTIKEKKPDMLPLYCFDGNYGHQVLNWGFEPIQTNEGALETIKAIAYNDQSVLDFAGENSYIKKYAEHFQILQKEGLIDDEIAITGTQSSASEAFAEGKTAMILTGTWWYGSMAKQFPDSLDSIGVAPLPSIDEGHSAFNAIVADSAISYSATSPYQEEIALVLEMLYEEANLIAYSESRGAPSAFVDVKSNWGGISGQAAENFEKYPMAIQLEPPAGFGMSDINMLTQDLVVGTYTAEEYAQEFANRWNGCYSE